MQAFSQFEIYNHVTSSQILVNIIEKMYIRRKNYDI
jgi:hypothetical protein